MKRKLSKDKLISLTARTAVRIYLEQELKKWNSVGLGFFWLKTLPSYRQTPR